MSDSDPAPRPARRSLPLWGVVLLGLGAAGVAAAAVLFAVGVIGKGPSYARPDPAELAWERESGRDAVVAAFHDTDPPSADEARPFIPVFDIMADAIRRKDAVDLRVYFDPDRFAHEFLRAGGLAGIAEQAPEDRKRSADEAGESTCRNMTREPFVGWDRTAIRRIRRSPDGMEAVVIAVHTRTDRLTEGVPKKFRWWLKAAAGRWRVYDYEDLTVGCRQSTLSALLATAETVREVDRFRRLLTGVYKARIAAAAGDWDAVDRACVGVAAGGLPAPLAAQMEVLHGSALVARGKPADALPRFDAAGRLAPDMPAVDACRAVAFGMLDQYDRSLDAARRHAAVLGPDPFVTFLEGEALAGLNRPAEAAAAYRVSLDIDPDRWSSIGSLRRVLPPADKRELTARLTRMTDPKAAFADLVRQARADDDTAGVAALVAGMRQARPNDAAGLAEDIRLKVAAGRFPEADALFKTGRALPAAGDRELVRDTFLYAMADAGKAVDSYAAMSAADMAVAFRILAARLDDTEADHPLADDATAAALRGLIAAHRARAADDPWLRYFDGMLLRERKDDAGAERLFAEGAALLARHPEAAGDDDRWPDTDMFRSRRVACLCRLGRAADAYPTVGPIRPTFWDVAAWYQAEAKWDDLRALIDAHEAADRADPAVAYWRGQLAFAREDYPAAVAAFERYRTAVGDDGSFVWLANDRRVRALLRSGRVADAGREAAALEAAKRGVSLTIRAATLAATGDVDGVDRFLADRDKGVGYGMYYDDPDFARAVADPRFDPIRRKYPPPAPDKPGT